MRRRTRLTCGAETSLIIRRSSGSGNILFSSFFLPTLCVVESAIAFFLVISLQTHFEVEARWRRLNYSPQSFITLTYPKKFASSHTPVRNASVT